MNAWWNLNHIQRTPIYNVSPPIARVSTLCSNKGQKIHSCEPYWPLFFFIFFILFYFFLILQVSIVFGGLRAKYSHKPTHDHLDLEPVVLGSWSWSICFQCTYNDSWNWNRPRIGNLNHACLCFVCKHINWSGPCLTCDLICCLNM